MPNAISSRRIMLAEYAQDRDEALRRVFATERARQNARYHYRVTLKGGDTAALAKASDVLDQAESDHNLAVGLCERAQMTVLECELAEAREVALAHEFGEQFEEPSTRSNVLPFVQDEG